MDLPSSSRGAYEHLPKEDESHGVVTGYPVEGPVQGAPASAEQQQAREQVEGFPSPPHPARAHPVLREEFCLPYDCNFTIWEHLDPRDRVLFDILDQGGTVRFRVLGPRFGGQRFLVNAEGTRCLLAMMESGWSSKWRMYTDGRFAKSSKVATIKPARGNAEVRFKGAVQQRLHPGLDDKQRKVLRRAGPDNRAHGDGFGTSVQLQRQGQPELAMEMQQIQWPHSYGLTRERVPSTRKAYELHVTRGTDTAYASALAIVLHDICFRSQVNPYYVHSSYGPYGTMAPGAGFGLGLGLALPALLLTGLYF